MKFSSILFLGLASLAVAFPAAEPEADVDMDADFEARAVEHHGDGTHYGGKGGIGACGPTPLKGAYAALSQEHFPAGNPNHAPVCGRKARVHHNGKSTVVTIRDKCAACQPDDIDLNPPSFKKLAPLKEGRIPVTWEFIS